MKSAIYILLVVALAGATPVPEVDVRAELAADINYALDKAQEQMVQVDFPVLPGGTYKVKKDYPHLFMNAKHIQGVVSLKGMEVEGLDSVKATLAYCPLSSTLVGELCIEKIHVSGKACANLNFVGAEKCTVAVGKESEFDITVSDIKMKNLRVPIRYCPGVKTLQLVSIAGNTTVGELSGKWIDAVDGEGNQISSEDFNRLAAESNFPILREILRNLFNLHIPRSLMKTTLISAFAGIASA